MNPLRLQILCFCFLVLFFACDAPSSSTNNEPITESSTMKMTDTINADQSKVDSKLVAKAVKTKLTIVSSLIDTSFSTDYIMGKFDPAKHSDFELIDSKYASRAGMYMRKDAYLKFKEMHEAAKKDGIKLMIKSATRNFNAQKAIWEGKWNGKRKLEGGISAPQKYPRAKDRASKILEWSSMPGTSRHHWGTDIDLNAFVNSYFEKGQGLKEYEWLSTYAGQFGFCQPYSPKGKNRPAGYNEEKWHWSFLPVAMPLTQLAESDLSNDMISGFDGANTAAEIDIVNNYILGINPICKHK